MPPHYFTSDAQRLALFDKITAWITTHPHLFLDDKNGVFAQPFIGHLSPAPLTYKGNSRLGFWYQHLCKQLFNEHPDYNILAEEVQLNQKMPNDQGKIEQKTIGALDFLLKHNDPSTGKTSIEHWEVAVKFYLLFDGLWYGPNSKDRLDLKLSHMLEHQLAMSQHPCFQQKFADLANIKPKLLMQGRLYINPFREEKPPTHCSGHQINTSQINGFWCFASEFERIKEPLYALKKGQWLTGKEPDSEKVSHVGKHIIHAQTTARQGEQGRFWFIVPDGWPSIPK